MDWTYSSLSKLQLNYICQVPITGLCLRLKCFCRRCFFFFSGKLFELVQDKHYRSDTAAACIRSSSQDKISKTIMCMWNNALVQSFVFTSSSYTYMHRFTAGQRKKLLKVKDIYIHTRSLIKYRLKCYFSPGHAFIINPVGKRRGGQPSPCKLSYIFIESLVISIIQDTYIISCNHS